MEFVGERRLAKSQIDLIRKWVEAGAPEGKAGDSPPAPKFTPGWQLGAPDLVVEVPKPLRVPAEGPDVYWNFVFVPAGRRRPATSRPSRFGPAMRGSYITPIC